MSIILWTYLWSFTLGHYQLITQPLSLDSSGLVLCIDSSNGIGKRENVIVKTSVSDRRSVKKVQRLNRVRATLHHPRHDRTKLYDGRTNCWICSATKSVVNYDAVDDRVWGQGTYCSSAMPSLHLSNRRRSTGSKRILDHWFSNMPKGTLPTNWTL